MSQLSADVAGFITVGRVGRLGTVDAGGQPLVVPVCYAFDGEALFSAIDAKPKTGPPEGLKRIKNIRENSRVSVVIDEYDEDWRKLRYVIIQGRAEVLSSGREFTDAADLLLAKYPQYRAMGLSRETGTMIKVTPTRVLRWSHER
jgi:PPOX class probable F420-dependent enzyme